MEQTPNHNNLSRAVDSSQPAAKRYLCMMKAVSVPNSMSIAVAIIMGLGNAAFANGGPPYQASGVKVGEVDQTSAIVWTRLTKTSERRKAGYVLNSNDLFGETDDEPQKFFEGVNLEEMHGAVTGLPGEVRLSYSEKTNPSGAVVSDWVSVDNDRDYTHQFKLTGLKPKTEYAFKVESRASAQSSRGALVEGRFATPPEADDPARVMFTVVTGQKYQNRDREDGHQIFSVMAEMKPDFFVHTGDIVYMNGNWIENGAPEGAVDRARHQWSRIHGLEPQKEFYRVVPAYMMKDDHDIGKNDCYPGKGLKGFSFEQGIKVFEEQVPSGDTPYRTRRWGKNLQVWMMEGRNYRSPNNIPDGPGKTIWGEEQIKWLQDSVKSSDAAFKILISPTPLVGPDRSNKGDNHANETFAYEGNRIRKWIQEEVPELFLVCGDRHWQYVSVHPETGVREYSCGSTTDKHAGGWSLGFIEEYHRYLNVIGGFLSVIVERVDGKPNLIFRHHDVEGRLRYVERHDEKGLLR